MIFDAAKIEWKIEVTLASIKLKKVNFYFSKKNSKMNLKKKLSIDNIYLFYFFWI
jgi:hypothetical protein